MFGSFTEKYQRRCGVFMQLPSPGYWEEEDNGEEGRRRRLWQRRRRQLWGEGEGGGRGTAVAVEEVAGEVVVVEKDELFSKAPLSCTRPIVSCGLVWRGAQILCKR